MRELLRCQDIGYIMCIVDAWKDCSSVVQALLVEDLGFNPWFLQKWLRKALVWNYGKLMPINLAILNCKEQKTNLLLYLVTSYFLVDWKDSVFRRPVFPLSVLLLLPNLECNPGKVKHANVTLTYVLFQCLTLIPLIYDISTLSSDCIHSAY